MKTSVQKYHSLTTSYTIYSFAFIWVISFLFYKNLNIKKYIKTFRIFSWFPTPTDKGFHSFVDWRIQAPWMVLICCLKLRNNFPSVEAAGKKSTSNCEMTNCIRFVLICIYAYDTKSVSLSNRRTLVWTSLKVFIYPSLGQYWMNLLCAEKLLVKKKWSKYLYPCAMAYDPERNEPHAN